MSDRLFFVLGVTSEERQVIGSAGVQLDELYIGGRAGITFKDEGELKTALDLVGGKRDGDDQPTEYDGIYLVPIAFKIGGIGDAGPRKKGEFLLRWTDWVELLDLLESRCRFGCPGGRYHCRIEETKAWFDQWLAANSRRPHNRSEAVALKARLPQALKKYFSEFRRHRDRGQEPLKKFRLKIYEFLVEEEVKAATGLAPA